MHYEEENHFDTKCNSESPDMKSKLLSATIGAPFRTEKIVYINDKLLKKTKSQVYKHITKKAIP